MGILAIAAAAWWWVDSGRRAELVASALPPAPDLSRAFPMLRERIEAANTRARSRASARDGLVELSQLYHANGYLDEAMACYRALADTEPNEPRWPHLHANILASYGDVEPAIALWQRVIALAPDYTPARLRLGDSLLKANRFDEASAAYSAVLQREAKNPYALLGLARLDIEAGRDDQARERLETVVRQTNYQLGYDLIVSLYERTGRRDRAAAIRGMQKAFGAHRDPPDPWLDQLTEACFDPYRLALAAGAAGRIGDPATARRLLERAIEIDPNDVSARFQLGTLAVSQGDARTAREQLERCTILAPDFADAWAHLSALQADLGDHAGAERTLATGLRNNPQSPGLHLTRARSLRQAGRLEEAIAEFKASIYYRPNEPDAHIELGNMLIAAGREAEGVEQMKQALETDPANPLALTVVAFSAISSGNQQEADQWLTQIAQQPRTSRDHASRLLEAYRKKFGRDWRPQR